MNSLSQYLVAISLILVGNLHAQVPPFSYAKSFGSSQKDIGWGVAVDGAGNNYTTGTFSDTLIFGTNSFVSNGSNLDFFLMKHDPNGNLVWGKRIGGFLRDEAHDIVIDSAGNVYLTGRFSNNIIFKGILYKTNNSSHDAYVLKLDKNGNPVWFTPFGGRATDVGNAISVDNSGNVFVTGSFITSMIVGSDTLTSKGREDVFVVKLNSNGNPVWARGFGDTFSDNGRGIGVDANGNCYVAGSVRNSVVVGTKTIGSNGDYDAFLVKFNSIGTVVWAQNAGGTGGDHAQDLKVSSTGDCFMVGSFYKKMLFGNKSLQSTSVLYADGYILKYNNAGTSIWGQKIGGNLGDHALSVDLDNGGNVFVAGLFTSNKVNVGSSLLSNVGGSDAYLAALSSSGTFLWAIPIGGTGSDAAYGVAVYKNESVYTTGYFETTVDFDPGSGTSNLTSVGGFDAYVQKLTMCIPTSSNHKISSCNPYKWIDGNTYSTSNNSATHTLTNAAGCDSVVSLNLTIKKSTSYTDVHKACKSFTWVNGKTYIKSTTTERYTLTNQAGCDSIVTLNLSIDTLGLKLTETNDEITCLDSGAMYQWLDCGNNYSLISGAVNRSFKPEKNGDYACVISRGSCTDTTACVSITKLEVYQANGSFTVSVSPNPTTGRINVHFPKVNDRSIKVFNLSGVLVFEYQGIVNSDFYFYIEDIPGIYLLEIKSDAGYNRFRIVKQ